MQTEDSMSGPLLRSLKESLDSFLSSSSPFQVVKTISALNSSPSTNPLKTLFILDSSFNPPQKAHLSLAISALKASRTRYLFPHRLLLLFSTHNADKSPSPAAFDQRLALMTLFAEDALDRISADAGSDSSREPLGIDVGLTSQPYYNDKSTAIEDSGVYPSKPQHIHLTGFDTFRRIFDPKYYPNSDPPLAVLGAYFDSHGLRVTIRPDDEGKSEWGSVEEQRGYLEGLGEGKMEEVGARREWKEKIAMVEADSEGLGVSSTKVRRAVEKGDWTVVEELCTKRVARWIRDESLYAEGGGKEKI